MRWIPETKAAKKQEKTDEDGFEDQYDRPKKTTGADKFIDLLSKSSVEELSVTETKLDLQNRQLAFQEAELAERKAEREQKVLLRAQELELEKVKADARIKSDREQDSLFTTTLSLLMKKLT